MNVRTNMAGGTITIKGTCKGRGVPVVTVLAFFL